MRSNVLLTVMVGLLLATAASALEFREEPYRVGIIDVGDPVLLEYRELTAEMNLNNELRDWIRSYGRPEYAEFQKVAGSEPFVPYEIRLYYIEGRRYVAFGRIANIPYFRDFGVRKYVGKLDSSMLQRLLTARPLAEASALASAPPPRPNYAEPRYQAPAPAPVVVEQPAAEEVVEIISPQEPVVGEVVAAEVEGEVVQVVEEEIVIEPALEGEEP